MFEKLVVESVTNGYILKVFAGSGRGGHTEVFTSPDNLTTTLDDLLMKDFNGE